MSSKIVSGEDAGEYSPFYFRALDADGKIPPRRAAEPQGPENKDEVLARLQAQVAQMESDFPQQLAAARSAALQEGEHRGRAATAALLQPVIDRLTHSIQEVAEWKPKLRREVETEAVELSTLIARRVLHREISLDQESLQALIQVAFERVNRQEVHRVIVHPDQAELIRNSLARLTTRRIEVVADVSKESGTLIFETSRGALDASLDTQLREIEIGLADRLKRRA